MIPTVNTTIVKGVFAVRFVSACPVPAVAPVAAMPLPCIKQGTC